MNKNLIIGLIVLVLIVLGGGSYYYFMNKDLSIPQDTQVTTPSQVTQNNVELTGNTLENTGSANEQTGQIVSSGYNYVDNFAYLQQHFDEQKDLTAKADTVLKYETADKMVESKEFKAFVSDIMATAKKHKGEKTGSGSDLSSYIKEGFIADILTRKLYDGDLKMSKDDMEFVIQSVKRENYISMAQKIKLTDDFKKDVVYADFKKLEDEVKKYDVKKIMVNDSEFRKVFLSGSDSIIYKALRDRYNWNKTGIGYKPASLEHDFISFLQDEIDKLYAETGLDGQQIKSKIYSDLGVKDDRGLADSIFADFKVIVKKYNLSESNGFPLKREYSFDERKAILNSQAEFDKYIDKISGGKSKEFAADLDMFRLKNYLLAYLSYDKAKKFEDTLWWSQTRQDFIDKEFGKGAQNLFRISRYVSPEIIIPGAE